MQSGTKFDKGKPLFSCLDPPGLLALGQVTADGAAIHGKENWKLVEDGESRYLDAAMRHLLKAMSGEFIDPDHGTPHLAHVAWCCMAGMWFGRKRLKAQDKLDPQRCLDLSEFEVSYSEVRSPQHDDAESVMAMGLFSELETRREFYEKRERPLPRDRAIIRAIKDHLRIAEGTVLPKEFYTLGAAYRRALQIQHEELRIPETS